MPTEKLENAIARFGIACAAAVAALVVLVITACTVFATPRYWGIDHLAGAKYTTNIVESHPGGFAFGIFTQKELFGDGFAAADDILSKRKDIPLGRYNLRWSDTHSFSRKDFPKIVAEAKRGVPVVNKYPNVECEFSGATEHQLNAKDAQDLANAVLAVIPERCIYVNNPWLGKGAFIPPTTRIKNEVHGKDAQKPKVGGRYNWSADGSDVFDIDITAIKNRLSDADVFFFWTSQNNGRKNAADTTPRPQRKAYPTKELIKAQAFLATDQGNVSLPKRYLLKPKSDQHFDKPEPRALKPVLIFPTKVSRIELRGNGKRFISEPGQDFADGRTRYYFNLFGYQMALQANTGVFDVGYMHKKTIVENGKKKQVEEFLKLGTANPGFRQGEFR